MIIDHRAVIDFVRREYPKIDSSTKIENITHPKYTVISECPVLNTSKFEEYDQLTPLQKLELHKAQIKYYDEVKDKYFDIPIEDKKKRIREIMNER